MARPGSLVGTTAVLLLTILDEVIGGETCSSYSHRFDYYSSKYCFDYCCRSAVYSWKKVCCSSCERSIINPCDDYSGYTIGKIAGSITSILIVVLMVVIVIKCCCHRGDRGYVWGRRPGVIMPLAAPTTTTVVVNQAAQPAQPQMMVQPPPYYGPPPAYGPISAPYGPPGAAMPPNANPYNYPPPGVHPMPAAYPPPPKY